MTPHPARPLRADAARNRVRILDAAREQITTKGAETGMDEIAAAAGVAVGTLYRHFPTKLDLVAAVIGEYTATVAQYAVDARARTLAGASPLGEITTFLHQVVEVSATNHAVKAVARGLGVPGHGNDEAEAEAGSALAAMIAAGQRSGDVHPDVSVSDVYLLISTAPVDQDHDVRARWFALVLAGLSASAVRPALGGPEPS